MKLKKIFRIALARKFYFFNKYYYLTSFNYHVKNSILITSTSFDDSTLSYHFPLFFQSFISIESLLKNVKSFYAVVYCSIKTYFCNFLNIFLFLFSIKYSLYFLRFFFRVVQF